MSQSNTLASKFSLTSALVFFARFLFWVFSITFIVVMLILWRPPALLLEPLTAYLESIILEQTGLPVQIGRVARLRLRLANQQIELHNLHVYGYPGAGKPFLVIPQLTFESDLLSYLQGTDQTTIITADSAYVRAIRDAQGRLNLRPELKSSDQEKDPNAEPLRLPRTKIAINDLFVSYQDLGEKLPLKDHVIVPFARGDIYDGAHALLNARVRNPLLSFWGKGQVHLFEGEGWASADVNTPDLVSANRYLELVGKLNDAIDDFRFISGAIDGQLYANWNSWSFDKLRYTLGIDFDQVNAYVPYYRAPMLLNGRTTINEKRVEIPGLDLQTGASQLLLTGHVGEYLQKPAFDLRLRTPGLYIEPIVKSVNYPSIKGLLADLNPSGLVRSDVRVQGVLDNIRANGFVALPRFAMKDVRVNDAQADFDYNPKAAQADLRVGAAAYQKIDVAGLTSRLTYTPDLLTIHRLNTQIFQGNVSASGRLGLKTNALQANVSGRNLSLQDMQQDIGLRLDPKTRPAGRVNLTADAAGTLSNPRASGVVSSPAISFPLSTTLNPIYDLQTRFRYSKPLTTVALRANSTDAGLVKGAMTLRNMDRLDAKVEAQQVDLKRVNAFTPQRYFEAGTARLDASVNGSLQRLKRNWTAFDGAFNFTANQVDLNVPLKGNSDVQQHLDTALVHVDWRQGLAQIQQLNIENDDSFIRGKGTVSVPTLLAKKSPEEAFRGELTGELDLVDFPVLQQYDVYEGKVALSASATSQNGGFKAELVSTADNLKIKDIDLEKIALDTRLDRNVLTIREARLEEQGDQLNVKGQVDLNPSSPVLDLKAEADNFSLENLVALLPAGLRAEAEKSMQKKMPEPDELPNTFELPQVRQRKLFQLEESGEPLSLRWKEVYDHWDRWKLQPNTEPAERPEKSRSALESLRGELSLNAHVKGSVAQPEVTAQGLVQNLEYQDAQVAETFVNAVYKDKIVDLKKFYAIEQQGGTLEVQGLIDLARDLNLEVRAKGLKLDSLNPFLRERDTRLDGSLNALAIASGPVKDPEVTAELKLDRLLLNQIFFDSLATLADYRDGYVKDTRVELNYGDQQVVAYGDVPVRNLDQSMDVTLQLQNDSFGLVNLFTSAIDWRSGTGAILVNALGSPRNPQLEGTFSMNDTSIYIPALRDMVSNLRVKGQLKRIKDENGVLQQNVEIEQVTGDFGGGQILASGTMDLLNLKPSYLNLNTQMKNVLFQYNSSGLFQTQTPIEQANVRIRGLIQQPIISGRLSIGKGGETFFPFLRDTASIPTSSDFAEEGTGSNEPRFLFGGLNVLMPFDYELHSPIFDIPIFSETGITLRHRAGTLRMAGTVEADQGKLYLLGNILNVDAMNVAFDPTVPGIDPRFNVQSSFNVQGADDPVEALISGSLSDVKRNNLRFDFNNTQGLSETEIFAQLTGFRTVQGLSQGDIGGVATQFSDSVLRGLFDPLTSRLASVLGLEELSFGIAGQSVSGPTFKFQLRSSPFFFLDEYVEENLSQLEYLDRIKLRGTGFIDGTTTTYELGANYNLSQNWALDYEYEQLGAIQNVKVTGNYMLDGILRWMDDVRKKYFGYEEASPSVKGNSREEPVSNDEKKQSAASVRALW